LKVVTLERKEYHFKKKKTLTLTSFKFIPQNIRVRIYILLINH